MGAGSMMLDIKAVNNTFTVESIQEIKTRGRYLFPKQQTPLYYDDHFILHFAKGCRADAKISSSVLFSGRYR